MIDTRPKRSSSLPFRSHASKKSGTQQNLALDDGTGLSTAKQQYERTAIFINEVRAHVDRWRDRQDHTAFAVIEQAPLRTSPDRHASASSRGTPRHRPEKKHNYSWGYHASPISVRSSPSTGHPATGVRHPGESFAQADLSFLIEAVRQRNG